MMDIKQLSTDVFEQQQAAMNSRIADIQTSMPGVIVSYNPATNLAVVQPMIQTLKFNELTQIPTFVNVALIPDCPVMYLSSGGATITTPIAINNPCIIFFSSRCLDAYCQLGGLTGSVVTPRPQLEMRMHDWTDCYIIPCAIAQPDVLSSYSATDIQIRSNDGQAVISLNPSSHVISINTASSVNITSTGNTTLTCPTTQVNGDLHCTGTITGDVDVIGGGEHLKTHTHGGVQPGSGTSGGPS